jgi:hypothetical protein
LTARFGSRMPLLAGQLLLVLGMAMSTRFDTDTGFMMMLPAFVVIGVGNGMTQTPLANAVVSAIGTESSGAASGVMNTMRQIGGALGVAALGALFSFQVTAHFVERAAQACLEPGAARALGSKVAGTGLQAVASLRESDVCRPVQAAGGAFMNGLDETLYINAGVIALGALVTWIFVRGGAVTVPEERRASVLVAGE